MTKKKAIPREARAVRAALPLEQAEQFQQEWNAALDQAKEDMDLDGLYERLTVLTGALWGVASAWHSPNAAEVTEQGRRWQAGEDMDTISAEEVFFNGARKFVAEHGDAFAERFGLSGGEGDVRTDR